MTRRLCGLFVFSALLGAQPSWLWAQPAFPAKAMEAVNALYAGVNPQDDGARRVAIIRTCEQLAADLGPRWGGKKRAGLPDDYRSPDSLAFSEDDGSISIWDIQASSGAILVHAGKTPDYPRVPAAEAAFMACEPKNHMGGPIVGTPPPSPGIPVPVPLPAIDLSGLTEKVDALAAQLAAHHASEEAHWEKVKGAWDGFWKPFLKWAGMIGIPALTGIWTGMQVEQEPK